MKRWGKQARYARLAAEFTDRELIREAEEIVAQAWLAGVAEAVEEATTVTRVCAHVRDVAYRDYRAAAAQGDPETLERTRRELAASQQALGAVRDRSARILGFARRERRSGEDAAWMRKVDSATERERLGAAARAANVGVEEVRGRGR